jgi:predicted transcriptional regulator of viral defense system
MNEAERNEELNGAACYVCIPDGMNLIIQRARYIEDGWLIRVHNGMYSVYEIPQFGGSEIHLQDFLDATAALEYATSLT